MKCTSISPGVYIDERGGFWGRPCISGRYTWRKLKAVKQRDAIKEYANENWQSAAGNFTELADLYIDADCPNRRLEPRGKEFCEGEKKRAASLKKYFGPMDAAEIRLVHVPKYKVWRLRKTKRGTGERAVDKDTQTLSNVLNYGVAIGHLEINYIRSGRPRYRREADIRHSREVAPATADTIHRIANFLLDNRVTSEVFAWQSYLAMFTGCRSSELRRLRVDAATPDAAGFIQLGQGDAASGYLFLGRRSKHGVNPWAMIGPDFAQMLDCFHRWHAERFGTGNRRSSVWYFPGHNGVDAADPGSFGHALTRACKELELPHITPHGFRSFYVTKRRSDGVSDTVIAGEIGDKTVSLMQTTYGARPENWTGGAAMTWLPKEGLPAWLRWQDAKKKVVKL